VGVRGRVEWLSAGLAVALGAAYLLLPPMGSDLSAQVARAGFFAGHGYTPVDLRWYGGVNQLGYSLVSQPVMATLGVRVTGAAALVVAAVALAALLRRTAAPRPVLGAVLGVVGIAGNLVSGRVTYALGVAIGLLALLTLTYPRLRWAAPLLALLGSATSPVAGLFLGLAGAALLLSGRIGAGLLIALPAAVPLGLSAVLFGDGGWMNIGRLDAVRAIVTSLIVAALVPLRPVRIGGVLSALGVLAAALIHTPVGLNATRLVTMFALPLLAGYATLPGRRLPVWGLAPLLVAITWWQPPVVVADVRDIGNPTADPAYFRPLRDELARLPLTGRVEIPPTRAYWEAAHLGDVPLARGWLRQADIDRNPLFFTTVPGAPGTGVALTAQSYREWLAARSVQYVAVPAAELSWVGRAEAELVSRGQPYLRQIWAHPDWTLYAVAEPQPIVAPPARLVAHDAASLTFDAPAAGRITVRIRHYRALHATGGARVQASGVWTLVEVPAPGRYTLTS
jgi:TM2 domain-containing membrane protein YozV